MMKETEFISIKIQYNLNDEGYNTLFIFKD